MQYRSLVVLGALFAALATADRAQAYPDTAEAAESAETAETTETALASVNEAGNAWRHGSELDTGAFENADRLLKSVGSLSLSSELDPENMLRTPYDLIDRKLRMHRPQVWLPASYSMFSFVWHSDLGVSARTEQAKKHLFRNLHPHTGRSRSWLHEGPKAEGRSDRTDMSAYGIVNGERSGLLAVLTSVINAVQSGVGHTVSVLRGLGGKQSAAV